MIIVELPNESGARGLRVLVIGSCRVQGPLLALRDRGEMRVCAQGLAYTHTVGDALQTMDLLSGDLHISDFVNPYVFGADATPGMDQLREDLVGGIDIFLLEISSDKQFLYRNVCLQQNFVAVNLVQHHGRSMLDWFRQVSLSRPVDERRIQATLEALREGRFRHDDEMADLLGNVRLERNSAEQIADRLAALIAKTGGRCVLIGMFAAPGDEGVVMKRRRVLNEKLRFAAARCGALFYDPTELLIQYGKEIALDGGEDIYEYSEDFYATVGETLVSLVRTGAPVPARPRGTAKDEPPGAIQAGAASRLDLADRVDRALVSLHRDRLERLGLEASGLYAHYAHLVAAGSVVRSRERAIFHLIDAHLPRYDGYAVLRAGLGEVALLLAASGHKVTAYEPNPNRSAAISAGAVALESMGMAPRNALTILPRMAPEGPFRESVLGVALDAAYGADQAATAALMQQMVAFEALLIDPRLFLSLREDAAERAALTENLQLLGFDQRRAYGVDGLAWFHRSARGSRPSSVGLKPILSSGAGPRRAPSRRARSAG